jgi:integrase
LLVSASLSHATTSIFRQRIVTISRSLSSTKRDGLIYKRPKNDRVRAVCASSHLLAILESHRAVQAAGRIAARPAYHDEDLIFAKTDGTPISSWLFSSAFRNFMKRCPVRRIRFHDLRDTHASLLAKAGEPIEVISKRLGHSDISITYDRYITVIATVMPRRRRRSEDRDLKTFCQIPLDGR